MDKVKFLIISSLLLPFLIAFVVFFYIRPNFQHKIVLQSKYPGYELVESTNFSRLQEYLKSIGFWDTDAVVRSENGKQMTARELVIILTNLEQPGDSILTGKAGNNQVMSSFSYTTNSHTVYMLMQVNPEAIEAVKLKPTDALNVAILRATYLLTTRDQRQWQEHTKRAEELVREWYQGKSFIYMQKKTGFLRNRPQSLFAKVYAVDCARWQCGIMQTNKVCSNDSSHSCNSNGDCDICNPTGCSVFSDPYCTCTTGTCNSTTTCLGSFWESATDCSVGCFGGGGGAAVCVVPNSLTCNCPGGGTLPPLPTSTATPTPTPGASCGDLICNNGENCGSCPGDCGACPPPPPASCGDGSCNNGETCSSCPADCGSCPPPPPTCGNGTCGGGESCASCPADCGTCPSGTIKARAAQISVADTSCTAIRASTTYVNGTQFQFANGSASQPVPQTQVGGQYVQFNSLPTGSYTLSGKPPVNYVLQRACWANSNGTSSEGLSTTLGGNQLITWDVGYSLGSGWVQTQGGNVYVTSDINSYIPSGISPQEFNLDGSGGYPGVVTYGSAYDFDSGSSPGAGYVSSKDWLVNETYPTTNYYELFYHRFGSPTTADDVGDITAVAQPASRATPYYVVGDMTTTGDWNVGSGENIIFLVNGNLTIGGKINITGTGFVAFIVNGNIFVFSSVGVPYTSSAPVVEGIYITAPSGTFATGTSVAGTERFVGRGTFIAGNFALQRDLEIVSQNTTTAAELFIYNPALFFVMPDAMRDVPVTWEEVAP